MTIAEPRAASARHAWLEPYRRITSGGNLIPEIDGLRFLAIISVFIYHLAGNVLLHSPANYSQSLRSNGLFLVTQILNVGVPLFFVISGFVLSLPFASAHQGGGKTVSLKKYFLRRLTRLEPPYLLCLLLLFALKVQAAKGTAGSLFPNLIASMFYVHNATFARPSDIDFVAWSLEIEVQFYILAPLLATVFMIRGAAVRRSVLAVLILLTSGISGLVFENQRLQLSLLGYGHYFLAGFLFSEFYLATGGKRRREWRWDLFSLAGWSLFLMMLVQQDGFRTWLAPWLILFLYIGAFNGVLVNRFVTNPLIITIGGMCYTIYLFHNYLIAGLGMATQRLTPDLGFTIRLCIQFLLIAPIVLAISALYFRFIERPCMRPDWPQRLKSNVQLRLSATALGGFGLASKDENNE